MILDFPSVNTASDVGEKELVLSVQLQANNLTLALTDDSPTCSHNHTKGSGFGYCDMTHLGKNTRAPRISGTVP
jgi:hypothetical protein